MKKCYFILSLIIMSTTAFAATDQELRDHAKNHIYEHCLESNPKMYKLCKKVSNCVVDNEPEVLMLAFGDHAYRAYRICYIKESK